MEYTLDIKKMISLFKEAENKEHDIFLDTSGEEYLFNILKRYYESDNILFGDIDMNSFDEDDIISLIDDKSYVLENRFRGAYKICRNFDEAAPKTLLTKKFF